MSERPWLRRHLCLLLCIGATPVALCAGVLSGGAGHGSYVFAKLLFPFTMALTPAFGDIIVAPLIVLAVVQYPIYGLLLDRSASGGRLTECALLLSAVHIAAAIFCFVALHTFR